MLVAPQKYLLNTIFELGCDSNYRILVKAAAKVQEQALLITSGLTTEQQQNGKQLSPILRIVGLCQRRYEWRHFNNVGGNHGA